MIIYKVKDEYFFYYLKLGEVFILKLKVLQITSKILKIDL